jgi:uncharacterized membrane protein YcaP (DUF421 family)
MKHSPPISVEIHERHAFTEETTMNIDWESLFIPSGSLVEIIIRGTVIYLALFLAMRFLPRRTIGAMGPADLLVVVVIADAVQNGMAGEYRSITEGLSLAAVIIGWATFIDWLDFKFPHLHIAAARPLKLISNGKILRENLKREQITEEELYSQLRQHGQDSPQLVATAYIEGDGHLSVIMRGREPVKPPRERHV